METKTNKSSIERFILAQNQNDSYNKALHEIDGGEKRGHWIWYIFPQLKGLGRSENANYYGLSNLHEAYDYFSNSELKLRLEQITIALLRHINKDINQVMGGRIDAIKLKSSMTLFDLISPNDIYKDVLDNFFDGERDFKTIDITRKDIAFFTRESVFSKMGITIPTDVFFESGSSECTPEQCIGTLAHLGILGYSLLDLGRYYFVNKKDMSLYRKSRMAMQFSFIGRELLAYLLLQIDKNYGSSKELNSLSDFQNAFEAVNTEWEGFAVEFDNLIAAVRFNPILVGYLKEYIGNHTLVKIPVYNNPITTPYNINYLNPNEIFVFGSNLAGNHGGGAARVACQSFGAILGQGVGLQGRSYAIPTMQGGLETIKPYVDDFIDFAKKHYEFYFLVTRIGCGIAGFRVDEVAMLFKDAVNLPNVALPGDFSKTLY
ncbi:MAG: A1S_2505 family phage non-structural protein [Phocaeicola sp.]